MKIGNPFLVPSEDISMPKTSLAETELSGIRLYALKSDEVIGLSEALAENSEDYVIVVVYPNQNQVHVYPYPEEEDVLENIWDIEYQIANEIYQ